MRAHDKAEPARPHVHRPDEAERTTIPASGDRRATDIRSVALTVLAVLAVILALQYAQSVLIPIVIAVLISYVLAPTVEALFARGVSRWIGAAMVLILLCGTLAVGTYTLAPQVLSIVDDMPVATRRLLERSRLGPRSEDASALEKMQRAATEIDKAAAAASQPVPAPSGVTRVQIVEPAFRATDYLWAGGRNVLLFLGQFAMVLFLVFFMLVSGDLFKRKLVKIAGPTLTKKKVTMQILDDINQQIGSFLRVQVETSLLVGVVTGFALWALGLRQYVIWGLFAGVFNSIPYLGPMIVTAGLGAAAFIQFNDVLHTTYVCAVALVITSLEGFLLTPALMGRAAQMNPVAIFVGLLFWSSVWGVWGTILGVPMMMMVKAICDRVEDLQPVGELLGE